MNQCLSRWLAKCRTSSSAFLCATHLVDRDEDVWLAEIAVVLRDLVLEDQVVAERVPGQVARRAVILVEVASGVREDDVRIDLALERLEEVLDARVVREVGVLERPNADVQDRVPEQFRRTRPCLLCSIVLARSGPPSGP